MWLNVDAGEHEDEPTELWQLADVVNVACGGHAGDAASMARVVAALAGGTTRIGAHPSYPDRDGFGRRAFAGDDAAIAASITAQVDALVAIARAGGASVVAIKPHGQLYWDCAAATAMGQARADAIATVAARLDASIIGPARGALRDAATRLGVAYLREGFADRATRPDGTLVPRGEPGAVTTDPDRAAVRAAQLVARGDVDTICVHADTPGALAIAKAVREVLAH
jgi:UPF0271 protein